MTEAIIGGRRSRFISSRTAPGVVLDVWEDLEVPTGDPHRRGLVLTFRLGRDLVDVETGAPNPNVPDAPIFSMGYEDAPSGDPVLRFQEAYDQERARAAERLGGTLHWEQIRPTRGE